MASAGRRKPWRVAVMSACVFVAFCVCAAISQLVLSVWETADAEAESSAAGNDLTGPAASGMDRSAAELLEPLHNGVSGDEPPAEWLRAEWLALEAAREEGAETPPTTYEDAGGGCDGEITGRWGFHTDREPQPWWQVDLGEVHALDHVLVWNRVDEEGLAARTRNLTLLLSGDGETWREVYQHDGTVFFGHRPPEQDPLRVELDGAEARYVRLQIPETEYFHLDEVQVIGAAPDAPNLALGQPADQSSTSPWSTRHRPRETARPAIAPVVERIEALLAARQREGIEVDGFKRDAAPLIRRFEDFDAETSDAVWQETYVALRQVLRDLLFASPALDFDALLFTKRVPGSYNHMSDQYYGWWSRPGGGIYLLTNLRSQQPTEISLTEAAFPEPGSFLRPDLSYDGQRILFSWARHYPHLASEADKKNKDNVPEDAFYQIYEMSIDGSDVRRLTHGKYDSFDARYLPDGSIAFVSTRRGQTVQAGLASAARTLEQPALPDSYVRCGGDARRPVAVYTLHTMQGDGSDMRAISPFEMFEWHPSVAHDGTILYSRWDYVDRDNDPYMSLWSINPDGTNARLVYGNYTKAPHCTFEPRAVPGSNKIVFTASAHHAQTMGSLVLLDPTQGTEGSEPLERLTPEVAFPEAEGWPDQFFANPWPLSEDLFLVSWGREETVREGETRPPNGMGLYVLDRKGGMEPLYRDADISAMYPIPLRPRPLPPMRPDTVDWDGPQEGSLFVSDVYQGLASVERGAISALRVVGLPPKTQPWMNEPPIGVTGEDPGKVVLGEAPVEADGSAYFRIPSGVSVFFQALDERGMAVQTMRSATHVQPGTTLSCVGCHESRQMAPPATMGLAGKRPPSKLRAGPDGSWPLRFDRLVQPVLDRNCIECHQADGTDPHAAAFVLTADRAYESLVHYGSPSLADRVIGAHERGYSQEGQQPAQTSVLLEKLREGHHDVSLSADDMERLVVWMDTYAQRLGSFSAEQERDLERLRAASTELLIER